MENFLNLGPIKIVEVIFLLGVYGWFVYRLGIVLFLFVGGDNHKLALLRIISVVAFAWFFLWVAHMAAFWVWDATPLSARYDAADSSYRKLCGTYVQDDENSGHFENDWHGGYETCQPLSRELYRAYPRPSWLFGDAPDLGPD